MSMEISKVGLLLPELLPVPIPKFVKLIEAQHPADWRKASCIKDIIDDVFEVSVTRGLNDEECSLLLDLFHKDSLSMNDKIKLLHNIVPEKKIPAPAIQRFMFWFIANFRKDNINVSTTSRILQWIIGLLDYNLVDSCEIYFFYYDFYKMLTYASLVSFLVKILCKLTTPDDVTSQTVTMVCECVNDPCNKYFLALLNVFKGYKPHLMLEEVKKVDVFKVLNSVNQSMASVMKVRGICTRAPKFPNRALGISDIPAKNSSHFREEFNQISSLIPLPTYDFGGMDKFDACYPNSIYQAYKKFSRVPIPQNILSLLHSNTGFFVIQYQGIEVQMRFQNSLLQTLQNTLIYQELKSSDKDVEFLLRRIYCLQMFMHQGIPCVSVFLSGYLLNWDGVDYRHSILKLVEWTTFHSFKDLACNILRPLHMQFASNTTTMRKEIIKTLTNLIRNMFSDVSRFQQRIPFPFTKRGPKWTNKPQSMLSSVVSWTQKLITLGLSMERDSSDLLLESIHFYEMINMLEGASDVQMFTVVPEGVVLQSLLSQNPNAIVRICRLLLRYHKVFLPQLRMDQPNFYKQCKDKISLTSNCAQRVIYFLQNGQVVLPRTEDGIIVRDVPNESLAAGGESFCLTQHICLVSTYVMFESKKNSLDLTEPNDRRTAIELAAVHLKDIKEFIRCFSPSADQE